MWFTMGKNNYLHWELYLKKAINDKDLRGQILIIQVAANYPPILRLTPLCPWTFLPLEPSFEQGK